MQAARRNSLLAAFLGALVLPACVAGNPTTEVPLKDGKNRTAWAPVAFVGPTQDGSFSGNVSAALNASRIFAGPRDYPPSAFAAYGIVAFKTSASRFDKERHKTICEAYVSALVPSVDIDAPISEQMVTVWPTKDSASAKRASSASGEEVCDIAVANYGLATSLKAIRDAGVTGLQTDGVGPFLIAWSPSAKKGQVSAVVLMADLSDVNDYDTAKEIMTRWVNDIESKPELWKDRHFDKGVRKVVRDWADHYGTMMLQTVGLGAN